MKSNELPPEMAKAAILIQDRHEQGHLIIEGILLLLNAVMLFILLVKLNVSPAAVERAVTRAETTIQLEIAAIKQKQVEHEQILAMRGEWMQQIEARTKYQDLCWKAMAEAFPDIDFPAPPEIKFDHKLVP